MNNRTTSGHFAESSYCLCQQCKRMINLTDKNCILDIREPTISKRPWFCGVFDEGMINSYELYRKKPTARIKQNFKLEIPIAITDEVS